MTGRSLFPRLGVTALLLVVLVGSVGVAPAGSQEDPPSDLVATVTAAYAADPTGDEVVVRFDYEFRNRGEGIEFPGFFESLPDAAESVEARSGGSLLAAVPFGQAEGFTTWAVPFDRPLRPGATTEVSLTWTWPATADVVVVQPGALAFPVYAPSPTGGPVADPVVVVPAGFGVRTPGGAIGSPPTTAPPGGTGLVSYEIPVPAAYTTVPVALVDPGGFSTTTWPGPPEVRILDYATGGRWSSAVEARLEETDDRLDTWFGDPPDPFVVRRAVPGAVADPAITLGEPVPAVEVGSSAAPDIDRALARAWIAEVEVLEPWFAPALAAAYSGETVEDPAVAAMAGLAADVGPRGVRVMVDRLRDGTITYAGPVEEPQPLPPDWRTVLDLLEEVAGSETAADVFTEVIVADEDAAAIARRGTARADYLALRSRADDWSLPPMLRVPMAAWEFEEFSARQGEVSDTLATRDGLAAWAEELDLAPIEPARPAFEAASDSMAEADAVLREQAEALEAFDEAERLAGGDRGILARIGLWGRDPSGDLDEIRISWAAGDLAAVTHDAHDLADELEGAVGRGTVRLLVPLLVVLAVVLGVRRWRSTRPAAPASVAGVDQSA